MTLTRASLGTLAKRKKLDLVIDGHEVRIQKPSPLEYSQYLSGMANSKGEPDIKLFAGAISLLTARMWIDGDGYRLFDDDEALQMVQDVDIDLYEKISAECQNFAQPGASSALGESGKTTV
jgi:hypothetical protein